MRHGAIVDVYQEGLDTFRAMVINPGNDRHGKDKYYVFDLVTCEKRVVRDFECEKPIIDNIFEYQP